VGEVSLALLRAVANSQVMTQAFDETQVFDPPRVLLFPDAPTSWQDSRIVTARVRELERAGWVAEEFVTWVLTDAGRKVLDDAEATA
jgi:hypothetical protein